ncbi:formate dehydrogenase accessory protein FdhE [Acetobacter tropicalis]|uniref:Protein FdhE homolog n=1 Tax=Acetobacter tropicalis NBRC 101654 TaxID=749388 RepID=F7VDE9_9PROT|nr:formate dehydrogenase accessory protein FdhE [Acetobacter tropicalis]GAA08394.1 formate dehydrogenase accessory protein [Acetobacter tropicalis NBRC 101654]
MSAFFSDLPPLDKTVPGVQAIEPIILPRLAVLYRRRAERLRQLDQQAQTTEEEDGTPQRNEGYLGFAARLVDEQARLLRDAPLSADDATPVSALLGDGLSCPERPSAAMLEKSAYWQDAFRGMVENLSPFMPEPAAAGLIDLLYADRSELAAKAAALLAGDYAAVDAGRSVILWAALSVFWAQAVALAAPEGVAGEGLETGGARCPCCGAPPSGGLVLTGDREGLRYLQCSLCETRWHKVRATCSVCGGTDHVNYWSFETTDAVIQGETCGDCHGYVKLFRQDRDPALEVVADDLASLGLDAALEEQGYVRATLNPFAFPV